MSEQLLPLLVCIRAPIPGAPLYLADNVLDACGSCGATVQRRPHTPKAEIMCVHCFLKREMQPGETVAVTDKTLLELAALMAKGEAN